MADDRVTLCIERYHAAMRAHQRSESANRRACEFQSAAYEEFCETSRELSDAERALLTAVREAGPF